ncbi:MAG: efflux RND transporter permease subunit [Bacteroidales bacterium]|nr:efflux RND transporter permease subunit [Bacteroidales bacterium]
MIRFLIHRPIAVLMAFLGFFILGAVAYYTLPVSLLPDIAIPQITVKMQDDNLSAQEMESTRMAPLRRSLQQLNGLEEIRSESRNNLGIIHLSFRFGTNTGLAFIEANEMIDRAMDQLPREASRPLAIKANATDIPVFYLYISLKDTPAFQMEESRKFQELCDVTENVVRRRIEQLPEVAIADLTGVPTREIRIIPDRQKMDALGISTSDLERTITESNIALNSMSVRDGYYQYAVTVTSQLTDVEDFKKLYVFASGRSIPLNQLCQVELKETETSGYSLIGGKRGVTLAVIKQSDGNMDDLRAEIEETIAYFSNLYPEMEFTLCRDQSELLNYTINNLQTNFVLGFILIFIVAGIFIGDTRSSLVICTTLVVSVVITFFLFYLFGRTINIISLSGLILAVGMMIDNAIISTENIVQHRTRGLTLHKAVEIGTRQMITPMLSSSLTTVAVFVPLVFLSGIAGALFSDQAFSITAGLGISYVAGIFLLPVMYAVIYSRKARKGIAQKEHHSALEQKLLVGYDRGFNWVFRYRKACVIAVVLSIPLSALLFGLIEKERMPDIEQSELLADIDWNENLHRQENLQRTQWLLKQVDSLTELHTAYVGAQAYVLNTEKDLSSSEAELYLKVNSVGKVASVRQTLDKVLKQQYPRAAVTYSPPSTLFEKLFATHEPDLEARVFSQQKGMPVALEQIRKASERMAAATGMEVPIQASEKQVNLKIDSDRMALYGVQASDLQRTLKTAFRGNLVMQLQSFSQIYPVKIGNDHARVEDVVGGTTVSCTSSDGERYEIPLQQIVQIEESRSLKTITGGKDGTYVPFAFTEVEDPEQVMGQIREAVHQDGTLDVTFAGGYFSNKDMMNEMLAILVISLLLMFFILSAQFGSFMQPLIVLVEIPIDTGLTLLALWMCGQSLNIMSAIGIIVACGIVINDSILKIDKINELRKQGIPMMEAIHTAGHHRLRAIVMTTLTTVFAMLPILFTNDVGSQLQRPLAIAMMVAMMVGLLVSLFVIPLIYSYIYKR